MSDNIPPIEGTEIQAKALDGGSLQPAPSGDAEAALDSLAKEILTPPPGPTGPSGASGAASEPAPSGATGAPEPGPSGASGPTGVSGAVSEPAPSGVSAPSPTGASGVSGPASKDRLDEVELPTTAKAKSHAAFDQIKSVAREQIAEQAKLVTEANTRIATLSQELEDTKKLIGKVPVELETELKSLREFKASVSVESDPEFQKFDTTISANTELIYKRLLADGGMTQEGIDKIKSLGGPDKVDWDPLLPKLPLVARRMIESALMENERLGQQKTDAMEKAKGNIAEYAKTRGAREQQELLTTARGYMKTLAWATEREIPANATAEQKAELEKFNTAAKAAHVQLAEFLADTSPARVAEFAVGTLIAHQLSAQLTQLRASHATLVKEVETKVAAVTAERDKLQKELNAVKHASTPRLPGGQTAPPPVRKVSPLAETGDDALTRLAREVNETEVE